MHSRATLVFFFSFFLQPNIRTESQLSHFNRTLIWLWHFPQVLFCSFYFAFGFVVWNKWSGEIMISGKVLNCERRRHRAKFQLFNIHSIAINLFMRSHCWFLISFVWKMVASSMWWVNGKWHNCAIIQISDEHFE